MVIKLSDKIKMKMLRKRLNTACVENEKKLSEEVIQAWIEDNAMYEFRKHNKTPEMEILKNALVYR